MCLILRGLKHHKVTSRRFPNLLGENRFNSVGYTILEMFKLLQREEIKAWYTIRGAVAEHFVNEYLKGGFYENTKFETVTFAPQQFKYYDQFYGKNDKFGGVIDIAIPPIKMQVVPLVILLLLVFLYWMYSTFLIDLDFVSHIILFGLVIAISITPPNLSFFP